MEFYTYIWRDGAGVPFYVGKGRGLRAQNTTNRSKEFKEVYLNGGCSVEIVDWFIHESQAHAHEVELIELYGRRDLGGSLINKTDGGEGASGFRHRPETIEEMRNSRQNPSEDTRLKISKAKIGKARSLEVRAKISASMQGNTHGLGRKHSQETLAKMIAAKRNSAPLVGYKGVYLNKSTGKWRAIIKIDGKSRSIGSFATPESAALAYDAVAREAFGNDCYLNFRDRVVVDGHSKLAEAA